MLIWAVTTAVVLLTQKELGDAIVAEDLIPAVDSNI